MGARSLGARLTRRFVAIAASSIALVAIAAVWLTSFTLDRTDSSLARTRADALHATLLRELAEGDSLEEASKEVLAEARSEGVRATIVSHGARVIDDAPADVPRGECETSGPWRACSTLTDDHVVVAAVRIDAHRSAVRELSLGMLVIALVAIGALVTSTRRAIREPVDEVGALVAWTRDRTRARPRAETQELADLGASFEALVERLVAAADRERATSAHIAHELRTPLTALLAQMDTAERQGPSMLIAATARDEVVRLAEVIEAILVVSDRGAKRPTTLVNVADLARAIARDGVTVEAPDEALTEGDERLITLALVNLRENADKHGGGMRRIEVTKVDDAIRISVLDEGPGMSDEGRAKMFERYWRGVADGSGKGLGLALVRAVAELHGGKAHARPAGARGLDVGFTLSAVTRWSDAR